LTRTERPTQSKLGPSSGTTRHLLPQGEGEKQVRSPLSRGGRHATQGAGSTEVFNWPIRVYWEDTDAGGVVYHGAYVRFFERARTEYLRSLGAEQSVLLRDRGIVFAIVGMDLRFDAAARLDDQLEASCELVERRGVSLKFIQVLRRVDDNVRIARASVRAACLDAASFKPRAIPEDVFVRRNNFPAGVSG